MCYDFPHYFHSIQFVPGLTVFLTFPVFVHTFQYNSNRVHEKNTVAETQYKHDVDVVFILYNLSLNPTRQVVGLLLPAITLLVEFEDSVTQRGA